MAEKHIKRIKEKCKQNPLHRHQIKIIKKLKMELDRDGITIMSADKNKVMDLIDSKQCLNKVHNFLKDNNIASIQKDPTTKFHKQIQKIIQLCPHLIDTRAHRFLTQMLPKAPPLNILIKTHKENMPIRPVINNKLAPSRKLAKHLNKKIHSWQILPNTYNARNSLDIAEESVNLEMNISNRIITLDIKDLYTNLPKQGILTFWTRN